jgi:hypothetical protein
MIGSTLSWLHRWRPRLSVIHNNDSIYMIRIRMSRLRFHLFFRGDTDPDPHDHPWGFWTFPLRSYVEELPTETGYVFKRVLAFQWHYRPASHTHRVIGPYSHTDHNGNICSKPGKIFTVVWREEESRKWGFLKRRDGVWCWMYWKDYVNGGKHTPCNDQLEDSV